MPKFNREIAVSPIDFVDACDTKELQELKQYLAGLQDSQIRPEDETFYMALHKIGENRGKLTVLQYYDIVTIAENL